MAQRIYFISDIHFGAESKEKEFNKQKLFDYFLNKIVLKDAKELFIVGDLFDFWFEYKNVVLSEHHNVIRILSNAVHRGLKIHYIAGNHDFWLGDYLEKQIGIHIYPDAKVFHLCGKNFYLCHGDGVAKRDHGYRIMKKILRHKISTFLYRWLHPDLGVPFAKFISNSSRKYTNHINLNDHNDYLEFAEHYLNADTDFVLMGHRHNPFHKYLDGKGHYFNLGDWLFNFTYAYYEKNELHLSDLKAQMEIIKNETKHT